MVSRGSVQDAFEAKGEFPSPKNLTRSFHAASRTQSENGTPSSSLMVAKLPLTSVSSSMNPRQFVDGFPFSAHSKLGTTDFARRAGGVSESEFVRSFTEARVNETPS